MEAFFEGLFVLAIGALYVAWFTVLPTIGLLWAIGWLS